MSGLMFPASIIVWSATGIWLSASCRCRGFLDVFRSCSENQQRSLHLMLYLGLHVFVVAISALADFVVVLCYTLHDPYVSCCYCCTCHYISCCSALLPNPSPNPYLWCCMLGFMCPASFMVWYLAKRVMQVL